MSNRLICTQFILIFLLSLMGLPTRAQRTIIHCGALLDGVKDNIQPEMTIIVEGTKITAVQKGYQTPAPNETVIDLRNKTVLPGLIDMHVHLSNETNKNGYVEGFRLNPEDFALRAVNYANKTLLAGFTTVRDLGGVTAVQQRAAMNNSPLGPGGQPHQAK